MPDVPLESPRSGRLLHGMRQSANWWQLVRFTAVGAMGYVVNLVTFAACVHGSGLDYRVAAAVAFLVAVTHNFWGNRHWTFAARNGHAGGQAVRFLVISVAGFGVNLLLLAVLVERAGLPEFTAQALAVAGATPCNFLGNKLWTFDA